MAKVGFQDEAPQPPSPGRPHYGWRRAGTAALAVTVLGGGLAAYKTAQTAYDRSVRAGGNNRIFDRVHTESPNAFRLMRGASVRFSPGMQDGDNLSGETANIDSANSGRHSSMIVVHPLQYTVGGNTWFGFNTAATHSAQGRKVHTRWVNATELTAEGLLQPLSPNSDDKPYVPIAFQPDGSIVNTQTGEVDPNAGTSFPFSQKLMNQLLDAGLGLSNLSGHGGN